MSELSDLDLQAAFEALQARIRACRCCADEGYPVMPGAVFSGPVTARVMVVGQAPGAAEWRAGRPFNGPAGRRLFSWLAEVGWDEETFRRSQYLAAVTRCYPGRAPGNKGDRVPSRAEQALCAPFLDEELALIRPRLIVPVGNLAIRRFLGPRRLEEVVGESFEDGDRWIVPLPHPSGASLWLNRPEHQARLRQALAHLGRLAANAF